MDLMDYSTEAYGMTYRNSLNPAGVTLDGTPDALTPGELAWEQLTGPQGTVTHVSQLIASFGRTVSSYHLDDATPSDPQCTGDPIAATTGAYVTSNLQIGRAHV